MPPVAIGRYSDAYAAASGPGDARPTAYQILKDNDAVGAHADKVILLTGGTDGLGKEAIIQLAKTGATVFFTARNVGKAEAVVKEIAELAKTDEELKGAKVDFVEMDLASLKSVQAGAEAFQQKSDRLNILIGNAGVAFVHDKTQDGWDLAWGTNHLAHFYLFQLLEPLLLKSSTPNFQSRVVAVSSTAHRFSQIQFGNINQDTKVQDRYAPAVSMDATWNPCIAYGQSKTANIWFANELDRRYQGRGLHALSLHPGNIQTAGWGNITPEVGAIMQPMMSEEAMREFKSVPQGAATTVLAAIGKEFEGKGGIFLEDCGISQPVPKDGFSTTGYEEYIYDPEGEKRLWKESLDMVGLKGE